ncbi:MULTISPECIES: NAD(P)/FAD-dependent oxidoreductase [unclassified Nocardiopsis]|uniref:NAD(P)/FAD-dependent oxidoreductase n=1 Tax=unclassified Nocardiopsis TaxID=2649073 RepID=UPI00135B358F|nr:MULTISPECIES: FAD-dependent oxidoreductase [unclassified Nocardiopsis]
MAHDIVVLGAGYAGLAAARRAAHRVRRDRLDARVTLVNAAPDFVERVRLHQVAAGQNVGVYPLADSLGEGVRLLLGWVEELDTGARTVSLRADGVPRVVSYDTLVLATGSGAADGGVPGADEHAASVDGLDRARALARRLAEERPARVAVVGGGFTGLEVAAELAESHPGTRVELLTRGRVAAAADPRGRAHVRRALHRLGVALREETAVAAVAADGLTLEDGAHVPADLVVWNAGFAPSPLAAASGLAVDGNGRALVDATQRSVSHPDVYVVGDAAHARGAGGGELRMSCAMGMPMGWAAADAIAARLAGRAPETAPFGYLFQCVSLGRRDGLIQFVRADDSPRRLVLTGRAAALYKQRIVASAYGGLRGGGHGQADLYLSLVRGAARRFDRRREGVPAGV